MAQSEIAGHLETMGLLRDPEDAAITRRSIANAGRLEAHSLVEV